MTHHLSAFWQASAALFRRLQQERRLQRDLDLLDERSRRELLQLLDYARERAAQDPTHSNRAASSRCGDQTKLSIGWIAARR
jgi:hypothetical protein